ncbi:MAG: leucine-rich repeat protein, partial [Ruminococcus sp.]|nr:leucine-rich repeat protein [Candidatus Copronaster equi]
MLKKTLSIILSIILIFSASATALAASADNQPTLITQEEYKDKFGAVHYRYVDENGNPVDFEPSSSYVSTNATLPSSYDARDYNKITSVKNQNPFGTCWAHAFCAAAESSLITQGYATKDNIDLSEAHLSWFTFNSAVSGSSNPVELDNIASDDPFDNGGNSVMAAATVARWSGLAKEADFPYSRTASDMQFSSQYKYVSDYQIDSLVEIPNGQTSAIKEAIMKNGALASSFYSDNANLKQSNGIYAYYQNATTGTNHAITIIGWDDNFATSNFVKSPGAKGAWLVKNSWGTSWGSQGYFWLSYYDTSIDTFYEVNAKPAGSYDNNYQYDGVPTWSGLSYGTTTAYMANIFKTKGTETVEGAYFKANTACTCKVSLYTGLTNTTKPTSGTLRTSKTIECPFEGYYTANFDTKYKLSSNTSFAIVIEIKTESGTKASIPLESNTGKYTYGASTGQSFFASSLTSSWSDSGKTYSGNIPIKAYTKNYKELTKISISSLPTKTSYLIGESFDSTGLVVTAEYSDGTSKTLTSDQYTISGFSSSSKGQKTVTVNYSGLSASFTVDVDCVNHNYNDTVIAPTWTSSGLTTHTCIYCGHSYDEITHMSGTNGNNIVWTFNEATGVLSISGSGNMINYDSGENPFEGVQYIKSVFIGSGITKIAENLFAGCSNLTEINVSSENQNYTSVDGIVYNKTLTELVCCPCGFEAENFSVSENVTVIGAYAFSGNTNIKSIIMQDSVSSIGAGAFANCSSLEKITIGKYIGLIEENTFLNCNKLNDIYFNSYKDDWDNISKNPTGNAILSTAEIHYMFKEITTSLSVETADNGDELIFGFNAGSKVSELSNYISSQYAQITITPARGNNIGTGSIITINYPDGQTESYTVVVFGDTNGDGWYDATDAVVVNIYCKMNSGTFTKATSFAADCNHDGNIDEYDVALIESAGIYLADIPQALP